MLKHIHPIAGTIGFLIILAFWTSTVGSELFGSVELITAVKRTIPWGFSILVPALAMTGLSGFRLAGGVSTGPIASKRRRMKFIAGNGLLVLAPSAFYLALLASHGAFDGRFYAVQAVELVAGAVNLALMALNMRDGLRLTGRLTRPRSEKCPAAPPLSG